MKIEVESLSQLEALLRSVEYKRLVVYVKTQSKEDERAALRSMLSTEPGSDSRMLWLSSSDITIQPLEQGEAGMTLPLKHLYETYRKFCVDEGYLPFGIGEFGRKLTQMGFERLRRAEGMHYRIFRRNQVITSVDDYIRAMDYLKYATFGYRYNEVPPEVMYDNYVHWCEKQNRKYLNIYEFKIRMKHLGFKLEGAPDQPVYPLFMPSE